jgi:hypothetical protein
MNLILRVTWNISEHFILLKERGKLLEEFGLANINYGM